MQRDPHQRCFMEGMSLFLEICPGSRSLFILALSNRQNLKNLCVGQMTLVHVILLPFAKE